MNGHYHTFPDNASFPLAVVIVSFVLFWTTFVFRNFIRWTLLGVCNFAIFIAQEKIWNQVEEKEQTLDSVEWKKWERKKRDQKKKK